MKKKQPWGGKGSKSKKKEKGNTGGQKSTRFNVFLVYHYLCFIPMVQYVLDISILYNHPNL